MKLLFSCILSWLSLHSLVWSQVPFENWQLDEVLAGGGGIIALRQETSESYIIRLGLGCLPALLDDKQSIKQIQSSKFGDLLEPYGNGDIGIMHIITEFREVRCKIIDVRKLN